VTLTLATEPPPLGDTLTASELCVASGISYRQCDFWTGAGYLKPLGKACPGHGYGRKFPATEARIAAYALELITVGFIAGPALAIARTLVEDGPLTLAGSLVQIQERPS